MQYQNLYKIIDPTNLHAQCLYKQKLKSLYYFQLLNKQYMKQTSLLTQLSNLKISQAANKIQPNQAPAALLFSQSVSRTIDIDLLYSIAIIGYQKLKDHILGSNQIVKQILSEKNKGLNRNHLSKQDNQQLSLRLQKLLLYLSPFFLSEECQKILDYLMRNYSVHIFEGQYLALTYIQYFEESIYLKLIKNINMERKNLLFLKPLLNKKTEKVAKQFMVKAFSHNNYLLQFLRKNTLLLISIESSNQDEIVFIQESNIVKENLLKFSYVINSNLLKFNCQKYLPGVIQYLFQLLKYNHQEAIHMTLILFSQIMHKAQIKEVVLITLIKTLLKKINKVKLNRSKENIINFIVIVWQRFPNIFSKNLIDDVIPYISDRLITLDSDGISGIFYSIYSSWYEGSQTIELLNNLALKVKEDRLLNQNNILEQKFYEAIFQLYQKNKQNLDVEQVNIIQEYLIKYFKFEFAQYFNKKTQQQKNYNEISRLFPDHKITNKGISMKHIIRLRLQKKQQIVSHKIEIQQSQDEDIQMQEQQNNQINQRKTLLTIVQQSHPQILKLEYNEITKQILNELISEFYISDKPRIIRAQKTTILENLPDLYTEAMLKKDVVHRDWILPILHIEKQSNIPLLVFILNQICNFDDLTEDIVYKDLLKLTINQLVTLSKTNYNDIINIFSKFGDQIIKICKQENNKIIIVLQICTYIVKRVIEVNGRAKGKLLRLVFVHIHILTNILNSNLYEEKIFDIFNEILQLYGQNNLYVFFLGFSQQITKNNLNQKSIERLKKILIGTFLEKETYSIQLFIDSCIKSLHLISYLVEEIQLKTKEKNSKSKLSIRIPKKILINLFGLINPKQKKKIIRNTFFILRYIFLSTEFSTKLQAKLKKSDEERRNQIIFKFSELYEAILSINPQSISLKNTISSLLNDLTNLFPLNILIKLLQPILPNSKLYRLINEKLNDHPKFKSKTLEEIILIQNEQFDIQWIRLIQNCLQRSCKVNEPWIKWLLQHENSDEIISIISEVSRHQQHILIPHLDRIIEILKKVLDNLSEYSLATAYMLIKNLSGLLTPYLSQIFQKSLQIKSNFIDKFFQNFVEVIDNSTLIKLAKQNFKITNNLDNFSIFLIHLCKKGTGEQLVQKFFEFLENVAKLVVQFPEINYSQIQQKQAQAFKNIVLKLNQLQLRKVMNNLSSWSQKLTTSLSYLPFNYKKIVLLKICKRLIQTMGDLFVPFYSFIYESMLNDIVTIQQKLYVQKSNKKNIKRSAQLPVDQLKLCYEYLKEATLNLKFLFENDKQQQFIDTTRFDQLVQPISKIFETTKLNYISNNSYMEFIDNYLSPTLIVLANNLKDDYKLKTLNFNILLKLKSQDTAIQLSIFKFVYSLIQSIGDKYLIFINELIPFIAEYIDSTEAQVQKTVKLIVAKIQEISGEDIREYIKQK